MKIVWPVLWLVALTTTVKGYKSCSEISEAKVNPPYIIDLGGKQFTVICDLASQPVTTTIPVQYVVPIPTPGAYSSPSSFLRSVDYNGISVEGIRAFIEQSESCKQYVAYRCQQATLFGKGLSPLSSWTSIDDSPKCYWANCSFTGQACRCDQGTGMPEEDEGFLMKKKDLPVKGLQIGGLSSNSNVTVVVGNITCSGDSQKNAFTFENGNSFVSLNLSSVKELKFKFKSSKPAKGIIASIQMPNGKDIKIEVDNASKLRVGQMKFMTLDEEWHSILLDLRDKTTFAVVDGGERKAVSERQTASTVGAKLILGDPGRKCNTFIGCIKDLIMDGQDYSKMVTETKMKEFVKKGCAEPQVTQCGPPKISDVDDTNNVTNETTDGDDDVKNGGDVDGDENKQNDTTRDGGDSGDDGGGGGGNDDAAIIAIVVVFLILLIILIVIFFITWYLKRNKGVYQTHEGSAENIHGDPDNLTLVATPCDETVGEQGKEYYL